MKYVANAGAADDCLRATAVTLTFLDLVSFARATLAVEFEGNVRHLVLALDALSNTP